MAVSIFTPCEECGEAVPFYAKDDHVCDRQRWLDYQICQLRPRIAGFEPDLSEWLSTPAGRFAVYYAERDRLRTEIGVALWA